jgi:hypothetical protein
MLRHTVLKHLSCADFELALARLCRLPPKRVVNPLFSLLYSRDPETKWKAVTAMGAVVAKLGQEDVESARVIIRRLMWNLNDESGGIGWGSPEAMGEILARHNGLAEEYYRILISYAREDGNFQEQAAVLRGVLWGIARLSQARPDLIKGSAPYLIPYLKARDPELRGLAAWIMGTLDIEEVCPDLEQLATDVEPLTIYRNGGLASYRVGDLATEALQRLSSRTLRT